MASGPDHRVAVRPATTDDIEFMVHLFVRLACQRHPPGDGVDEAAIALGTRRDTRDHVHGTLADSTTYVVELDGQRVGRLRVVRTVEQIEIAGLQVLPDYQGRGVGTAVIAALLQEGRTSAVPVVLQLDQDNPNAERLYRRLGVARDAETPKTVWKRTRRMRQG